MVNTALHIEFEIMQFGASNPNISSTYSSGLFYFPGYTLVLVSISNYAHYIKCGMKLVYHSPIQLRNLWSLGICK